MSSISPLYSCASSEELPAYGRRDARCFNMLRLLTAPTWALITILICACSPKTERTLNLYASASLTDVVQELGEAFETQTGIGLQYNFASSGALARQILASGKADLYLSANHAWMDAVSQRIISETRQNLLSNQLVAVVHKDSPIQELKDPELKYLAIGNPDHVPAGSYAKAWLESQGLWSHFADRLSLCPDVRAALAQAEHKRNICAIVYRTDIQARIEQFRILQHAPANPGLKIHYPVALLKDSPEGRQLLDFLKSHTAQRIYSRHGFHYLSRQRVVNP
ncbi:molybdenum ABC transporter, periplasmic molybdate-binding protein [Coraliomargarita akajimensis DSM 45221]|uniref:Molybdenum ABC transporter, periplasmic molybdate-binding protein n=2 Tax=Coraliomargarita TaxID=442430 RepID=D5EKT4_CORAD|nr:molybdenum ABC transporter, periplasmic molybdate-binding protein [Coraliomargarita akajimensis DSM 45221]